MESGKPPRSYEQIRAYYKYWEEMENNSDNKHDEKSTPKIEAQKHAEFDELFGPAPNK